MSKRRARRRQAPNPLVPIVLLFIAAVAGWFLLRPLGHHRRPSAVAVATAAPTQTPSAVPTPPATASPTVPPTASPEPSASPSSTPSARAASGSAKLALIIDDCGQWLPTERAFIALDVPLTLSVLPDVHGTAVIARDAHDAGKGVMLHLPMETVSGLYPGPGEVTTEMTDAQIDDRVRSDLAQIPLAQGVNNHEGSKASADPRVMRDVMEVLSKHGDLFFIDSRTSAKSVGAQEAQSAGVATASRDVFLDNKENVAYVEAQLREAASIAERTGSAIAIGHPRPTTLAAVRAMVPTLQAQGITFVLAGSLTH